MEDTAKYFSGTVEEYDDRNGYGYIMPDDCIAFTKDLLIVHRRSLRDRYLSLSRGDRVLFRVEQVPRGMLALDVYPEPINENQSLDSEDKNQPIALEQVIQQDHFGSTDTVQDWLAQAILARDTRDYDTAAFLYERGLNSNSVSVQLVLSYAAMEKNRNRKLAAARIYDEGIRIFPSNAKMREDAGVLAASLKEYSKALEYLTGALRLCRQTKQGGEKGILVALARAHFEIGSMLSLREAVTYYQQAQDLFGRGSTQLDKHDLLQMHIAQIRIQHQRGDQTVRFLQKAKFKILRAKLLDQITEGGDLIVEIDDDEFRESYGIGQGLLVRCMFKANITLQDIEEIDASITSKEGLCDEQIALMIVSSMPNDLQRILSQRIEQRKALIPAIIPLQQSEIETSSDPRTTLRSAFDRWLYRRDLFAVNFPVVGRRFFGRDAPLAEIRDAITACTPAGIFGLRKVGKTSLLHESQRRASEAGDVLIYIDLLAVPAMISDCRWIYWQIAKQLHEKTTRLPLRNFKWRLGGVFEDYLDIPSDYPITIAFDSDLTRLLSALSQIAISPKPRVVFLLDEIEKLLPLPQGGSGFSGFVEFFSYVRGISQQNSNFVIIITGANALISEAAQFGGRDNPVFNFFKEIYLQLLPPVECATMIRELGRGMGIRFAQEATSYIYSLTGGHPFFTRQLCSFVARHYLDRPFMIQKSMVEVLVDQYLDVRSSDFQEITERLQRDFPDELAFCIALAKADGILPIEQIQRDKQWGSTIRHLLGYQIVRIDNKNAVLTINLLTRWLRKRYVYD